jgi:MFS superfamily sulfate permease-like transporter
MFFVTCLSAQVTASMKPPTPPPPTTFAQDAVAGFVVALIALPLCLAIAMASGFPPFAGLLTAIVGGLLTSPLGGAPLTIKGPAAGLIVIVLAAVEDLGAGDVELGVRRTATLVAAAGVVQIALGFARAGKFAELVPAFAVRGMLASIGLMLLAKQAHVLLGVRPEAHAPLALFAELPRSVSRANPVSATIGLAALATMLLWSRHARGDAKRIPAPIAGLLVAVALGELIDLAHPRTLRLGGALAVAIPADALVRVPERISDLTARPLFEGIAPAAGLEHLALLVLIGTIETLVSAKAVGALDPLHRRTDLDRDLAAVGAGNLVAGLLGGLPMISEIVRSSANVTAGGRTSRANFAHGVLLLLFVTAAPALVHRLPVAALAAMLVVSGVNLASPRTFRVARAIGRDQALVFAATIAVTLATDLLVGVAVGVAVEAALHLARGVRPREFRSLAFDRREVEGATHLVLASPATFANALPLREAIALAPEDRLLVVDVSSARFVDHSVLAHVESVRLSRAARGASPVELRGLEAFADRDAHPLSTRHTPRAPAATAR